VWKKRRCHEIEFDSNAQTFSSPAPSSPPFQFSDDRLLIFADYQVYFEYGSRRCCEAIDELGWSREKRAQRDLSMYASI
jgi:hypothetical protein